jgi:hypothetical protein
MSGNTRTTLIITVAYLVIAYWVFGTRQEAYGGTEGVDVGISLLPVVILWGWWFYKRKQRR